MIVVMKAGATPVQVADVEKRVVELGYRVHTIHGVERVVIGCVGREDKTPLHALDVMPGVEAVIPILKPYKLVSRDFKSEASEVDCAGVIIGGKNLALMAGPCSVESEEQILATARAVKAAGAQFLRGGAFKPRTSPYAFQGLEEDGLKLLDLARQETGLRIVTEVVSVTEVDLVASYADVVQIGARNCQNFALLNAVGRCGKPALYKRGMSTTIKEYLQAAEYLLNQGNYNVILCERGIRTFETATRFTLDLNAVPVIKKETHLPIIVDPSHGVGIAEFVVPMAKAAVAAGCDGLIVEVHPQPSLAMSDGPQSLTPEVFGQLVAELRPVAQAVGRCLP